MGKEFLPPLQKASLTTVVGTIAMLASAPAQIWQIIFAPYMWMVNEEGLVLIIFPPSFLLLFYSVVTVVNFIVYVIKYQ